MSREGKHALHGYEGGDMPYRVMRGDTCPVGLSYWYERGQLHPPISLFVCQSFLKHRLVTA